MVADVASQVPILPVILVGGVGARLAPLSTPDCPKPFVPWPHEHCLYRQTIDRLSPEWLPPLVIGRELDRFRLLNHLRDAGCPHTAILLEEQSHNTGMAIALVVAWLESQTHAPVVLALLPADHVIRPTSAWQRTIRQAAGVAVQQRQHCLLSMQASWPESGYGYIDALPQQAVDGQPRHIRRFVEKPADPAALIASGMQWNTGQCIVTLDVLIKLFQDYAPGHLAVARRVVAAKQRQYEFERLTHEHAAYESVEAQPFDRIILERSSGYVLPMQGEWCDVGTMERWSRYAGTGQGTARTDRPWGYYEILEQRADRILKKLTIYPAARLSLQMHQYRDEHWRVAQGSARIQRDETIYVIEKNQEIHIPASSWHRLENIGTENLIIIEEQIGICDEADIQRRADDYGRA